ncbi:hypothetical protein [Chelatococcus composti]|uniref:Uncharacterized protein n=1 Tax=Chelatococcus composti TaxID=1743235 RepID=A0A841K3S5_9HYPH|nr:hypothetical protein [Chelatococcus composti]MBB6167157.1 hypothetical protein [Chelatococcus composti]MBS7735366.1 hypothetical protein [Chelatococcus composti]GGG29693.1 hypothetical protein GCM10008026_07730 [Chelatococcus composti]
MSDRFQSIRAALAMGPTPGPWELKDGRTDTIENAQGYPVCTVHHHPYELYGHGARAAYIAACDPDTIRGLLAERDELLALVHDYRGIAEFLARRDAAAGNDEGARLMRLTCSRLDDVIRRAEAREDRAALASTKREQA